MNQGHAANQQNCCRASLRSTYRKLQPVVSGAFAGNLLQGKTVGIIGAGRIGSAYARMMVEGHKASTSCSSGPW